MRHSPVIALAIALGACSTSAHAVGWRTQMNCAGDYYAYCSKYSVGTPEVRKCMRANGPRLSKGCISALIADGEISKETVEREKAKIAKAKSDKKLAAESKKKDAESAKKTLADAKKAPATKKSEPQAKTRTEVADLPPPPKPQLAKRPASRSTVQPTAARLTLDEATYAALKSRGDIFIEGDDASFAGAASPQDPASSITQADNAQHAPAMASSAEPAKAAPGTSIGAYDGINTGAIAIAAPKADRERSANDLADAGGAQTAIADASAARAYPPGRMSLGRNAGTGQGAEKPATWWDKLVATITGE